MHAVAALHRTFVATGFLINDSGADVPALGLWASPDGLGWQLVDVPATRGFDGALGRDVIAWHGRIVVVGATGIYLGQALRATVWIGRPTDG